MGDAVAGQPVILAAARPRSQVAARIQSSHEDGCPPGGWLAEKATQPARASPPSSASRSPWRPRAERLAKDAASADVGGAMDEAVCKFGFAKRRVRIGRNDHRGDAAGDRGGEFSL